MDKVAKTLITKLAEVLPTLQISQKQAEELVSRLAGDAVRKEAEATVDALIECGITDLDESQKEAAVDKLTYEPVNTMKTLVKLAEKTAEGQQQLLQSDIGQPVGQEKEASARATSEDVWTARLAELQNL